VDKFDELLLKIIDRTLRDVLGDDNALIIYNHLERNSCSMCEIPAKLDLFSAQLRNMLGVSRGQILGAPAILEDVVVKTLSSELGLEFETKSMVFEDRIRKLKESYNNRRRKLPRNPQSK
jgi:hypothetical protein